MRLNTKGRWWSLFDNFRLNEAVNETMKNTSLPRKHIITNNSFYDSMGMMLAEMKGDNLVFMIGIFLLVSWYANGFWKPSLYKWDISQ